MKSYSPSLVPYLGLALLVVAGSCSQVAKDGRTDAESSSANESPQKFEGDDSASAPTAVAGAFILDPSKFAVNKLGDHLYEVKGKRGAVERRTSTALVEGKGGSASDLALNDSGNEPLVISMLVLEGNVAISAMSPSGSGQRVAKSSFESKLKAVMQTTLKVDGTFDFTGRFADSDVIILKIGQPSASTPILDPPAAVVAIPSRQTAFIGITPKSTALGGAVTSLVTGIAVESNRGASGQVSSDGGIAVGDGFTCFLSAGKIYCNGLNARFVENSPFNSLPSVFRLASSISEQVVPTEVVCQNCSYGFGADMKPLLETFTQITAGQNHACALGQSGNAYCWGTNQRGQTGVGYSAGGTVSSPTKIAATMKFSAIAAGVQHTCAVAVDNQVLCWGDNSVGRFAPDDACTGSTIECNAFFNPTPITGTAGYATPGNMKIGQVVASLSTTCVRTTVTPTGAGPAFCWGDNLLGQTATQNAATPPPRVEKPSTAALIASGVGLPVSTAFQTLSAGRNHFCGMTYNGRAICWGDNSAQQITGQPVPYYQVGVDATGRTGSDTATIAISASGKSTCFSEESRKLVCRGFSSPQLGCGDMALAAAMVMCEVALPWGSEGTNAPEYKMVEGSRYGAGDLSVRCARATSGSYYCWGNSRASVLGVGGTTMSFPSSEISTPHLVAPFASH